MRVLAVLNQKGGVGKTTTTVNLGAALARRGRRVLLVDLDPQGNLTDHLGIEPAEDAPTAYDCLTEGVTLDRAALATRTKGLSVVPSHEDLAGVELELAGKPGREVRLKGAIAESPPNRWDWILIDCPPSLGLLSLNAMAAAREVLVTLQTEYFAMRGLGQLQQILEQVRRWINPGIRVTGILATLVDPVTNLAREVLEEVKAHYPDLLLSTRIRKSVRLAEAPGHRLHIFEYAADSTGAEDYEALAAEIEKHAAAATSLAPKAPAAKPSAPPPAATTPPPAAAKPPPPVSTKPPPKPTAKPPAGPPPPPPRRPAARAAPAPPPPEPARKPQPSPPPPPARKSPKPPAQAAPAKTWPSKPIQPRPAAPTPPAPPPAAVAPRTPPKHPPKPVTVAPTPKVSTPPPPHTPGPPAKAPPAPVAPAVPARTPAIGNGSAAPRPTSPNGRGAGTPAP